MPTISIFIRKGDLVKWQSLQNKSEWLSNHLNAQRQITQPGIIDESESPTDEPRVVPVEEIA